MDFRLLNKINEFTHFHPRLRLSLRMHKYKVQKILEMGNHRRNTYLLSTCKLCTPHLYVSVLGVHASNFQKLVAIKLYISELKYNLEVFTVQMLVED